MSQFYEALPNPHPHVQASIRQTAGTFIVSIQYHASDAPRGWPMYRAPRYEKILKARHWPAARAAAPRAIAELMCRNVRVLDKKASALLKESKQLLAAAERLRAK